MSNQHPWDLAYVATGFEHPQKLAEQHKPTIRKFEKQKVYSSFKDNTCGPDLADMQLTNKYNKGF